MKKLLFRILFNEYERVGIVWAINNDIATTERLSKDTPDFEQSIRYSEDIRSSQRLRKKITSLLSKEDLKWGL